MTHRINKPALIVMLALALTAQAYEVLILGDLHYDDQAVRKPELELTGGKASEFKRNLQLWQEPIPAMLQAAAARLATGVDFAVQLGDLTQGDCGAGELQALAFSNALQLAGGSLQVPFYTMQKRAAQSSGYNLINQGRR